MKALGILALLVVGACFGAPVQTHVQESRPAGRPSVPPSGQNEEWVASNLRCVAQLRAALEQRELTVEDLRKATDGDVRDDRLIGFGARRVFLAVGAWYTTAWIHILAAAPDEHGRSRIAELRIDQIGTPEVWPTLAPRLRAAWGREAREIERGLRVERKDEELLGELRAQVQRELGTPPPLDVPAGLLPAFELLSSPMEDLVLGRMYGEDGAPPPGREEMAALVAAGRFDLVRAVLRGMNPEGRAWAAHALLTHQRSGATLDVADVAAIEKLRALPLQLTCSRGCDVFSAPFTEALEKIDE